jgi:hypothetical protein
LQAVLKVPVAGPDATAACAPIAIATRLLCACHAGLLWQSYGKCHARSRLPWIAAGFHCNLSMKRHIQRACLRPAALSELIATRALVGRRAAFEEGNHHRNPRKAKRARLPPRTRFKRSQVRAPTLYSPRERGRKFCRTTAAPHDVANPR